MINDPHPPHRDYSTSTDRSATGHIRPSTTPDLTFRPDYHYALESLKNHLYTLANSTITEDVLKKLKEISQGILDTEEGIVGTDEQGIFKDFNLPQETQAYLVKLNQQIKAEGRFHINQLSEVVSIIKKNLEELTSERKEAPSLWLELTHLFKLPQIRRLDNTDVKKILELINNTNHPPKFRKGVDDLLTQEARKEIDDLLAISDYPSREGKLIKYNNLHGLLNSVIKQKPKQSEGFLADCKQAPGFFKDRIMDLTDPQSQRHHQGIIVNCSTHLPEKFFHLHDESEIHISYTYQVTCVKKHSCELWTAIQREWLNNQVCEIRNITDQTILGEIKPGTYRCTKLTSSSSSLEIELEGIGNSEKYKISAVYQENEHQNPPLTLSQWSSEKQAFIEICEAGIEWYSTYRAIKREEECFSGLNQANLDKHIKLKQDENKVKLFHLEQIQKQLQEISQKFMHQKNRELLNILLHNCLLNKLEKVDFHVLNDRNSDLAKKFQQISQQYHHDLQINCSPEDLLKKVIVEVNEMILIDREKSHMISKTMELLKEAYRYLEKIKGKKTIFFMGQTGSGKSTAVSYFLNAKLDFFDHPVVGGKIVKFKKEQQQDTFPNIGQSLSESNTLYTQGYALPQTSEIGADIVLADCPGFHDTRGHDYELCTHISMDLAIKEAESVQALIVVIPIETFFADRGNALFDLVKTIEERFPHVFNLEKPDNNASLYLLLTKDCQAAEERIASIRNGSHIQAYLEETKRKLLELQSHQHEAGNFFEVSDVQWKYRIWKALDHMQLNQIDFLDIEDPNEKDRLLKKYIRPPSMTKESYKSALPGTELQTKFGNYIEISTHTWIHQIFKQYLHILPTYIEQSQLRINQYRQILANLEVDIQERGNKILQLEAQQKDLPLLIAKLQHAQTNPSQLNINQRRELKRRVEKTIVEQCLIFTKEKVLLEQKMGRAKETLQKVNTEIEKLRTHLRESENQYDTLRSDIYRLSKGQYTDTLIDINYQPNEPLYIMCREGINKQLTPNQFKSLAPEEREKIIVENTSTYRGVVECEYVVDRQYEIVPTYPDEREKLESTGKTTTFGIVWYKNIFGYYQPSILFKVDEVKIEGDRFKTNLSWKASPNGKQIVYSFNFDFQSDGKLPWIKVSHIIPMARLNASTILNKECEIKNLLAQGEDLIRQLGTDTSGCPRTGKIEEKFELEEKIQDLTHKIAAKDQKIRQPKKDIDLQQLNAMLQEQQLELEKISQELIELKNSNSIEKQIQAVQKEKEQEETNLKDLQIKKRNLAILIHNQHESAKSLKEFAQLAIDLHVPEKSEKQKPFREEGRKALIETCQKFIEIYDRQIDKLKEECRKELGFSLQ